MKCFEKQLYVFFTPVDSSLILYINVIKVQLPVSEQLKPNLF